MSLKASTTTQLQWPTRPAPYRLKAKDISRVICHREKDGIEEYLVRWRTNPEFPVPPRAICSWHPLPQLADALHHVQAYIEMREPDHVAASTHDFSVVPANRKRKAPGADPFILPGGLPTPQDSLHLSRENSVISISSADIANETKAADPQVYNGYLEWKEGRVVAKKAKSKRVGTVKVNATKLPTSRMLDAAATAPVRKAERLIREAFFEKLKTVPDVALENNVDSTTPSLDFTFIDEFIFREGAYRADPGTHEGCSEPCRPNMGQNIGCEYTKLCRCLEYASPDEERIKRTDPDLYALYLRQKAHPEEGQLVDPMSLPKRFPYTKPNLDKNIPSTLQPFYLKSRWPIYECNDNCNCGPICKSRVVQHGRKVPLVIFKTATRGWGVYCAEDLVRGEFIDTYLGEVITNSEADRREATAGKAKASYLYSLDKHVGDIGGPEAEDCFVVDGQYMGSVTRFMNHSCEPNCRQYTVSYNKNDLRVYDLAFFAFDNIARGTELTFDYMDKDEEEEEIVRLKREEAARDPENTDKLPCNCGAQKCRGFLWV